MQPRRDIRFCLWIVRRWYFSFPAIGLIYGVIYLLAHRERELSALQIAALLGFMALLGTAFFGGLALLIEFVLRIIRRAQK